MKIPLTSTATAIFRSNPPSMHCEINAIADEIFKLLKTGLMKLTSHEKGEYVSPIIATPKKDCGYQLI